MEERVHTIALVLQRAPTRNEWERAEEAGGTLIFWLLLIWAIVYVVRKRRRQSRQVQARSMRNRRLTSYQREEGASSLGATVAVSASALADECQQAITAVELELSPRMRWNLFHEPLFAGLAYVRDEICGRYRPEDATAALERAKETAALYVAKYVAKIAEDEDENTHLLNVTEMLEQLFEQHATQYDEMKSPLRVRFLGLLHGRHFTAVKFLTQELNFRFHEDAILRARDRNEPPNPDQLIPVVRSNNPLGRSVRTFVARVSRSIDEHSSAA